MPFFEKLVDLPSEYSCRLCRKTKPIEQMIVIRMRREGTIMLRPRCKDCHNARERGHRREWKRNYLRRWRFYNSELNETYWKKRTRESVNAAAARFVNKNRHALAIQRRLRKRLRIHVSVSEARDLLKKYGPCYPTRFGLTPKGLREAERIRSRMRAAGKHLNPVEIRIMVYEDGPRNYIKPRLQKIPYQHAAQRLRNWQALRRAA